MQKLRNGFYCTLQDFANQDIYLLTVHACATVRMCTENILRLLRERLNLHFPMFGMWQAAALQGCLLPRRELATVRGRPRPSQATLCPLRRVASSGRSSGGAATAKGLSTVRCLPRFPPSDLCPRVPARSSAALRRQGVPQQSLASWDSGHRSNPTRTFRGYFPISALISFAEVALFRCARVKFAHHCVFLVLFTPEVCALYVFHSVKESSHHNLSKKHFLCEIKHLSPLRVVVQVVPSSYVYSNLSQTAYL